MPIDSSNAPSSASPLWIIALFIVLSEVMAGVASIATSGVAQIFFAVFAVGFPLIVFAAFSWLLVSHTAKLYAPNQYNEAIDPERFATGVNASGFTQPQMRLIAKAVAQAIAETETAANPDTSIATRAVEVFEQEISNSSITVDLNYANNSEKIVVLPFESDKQVDNLLDQIWFAVPRRFPPYTYGEKWVLVDEGTNREFRDIGTTWAKKNGESRDRRPLSDVGISAGSQLKVVPISR